MATYKTVSVGSTGCDYTALATAISTEATNLTGLGDIIFECRNFQDTAAVNITGYTTTSVDRIIVRLQNGAKNSGVWSTDYYRLVVTAASAMTLDETYIDLESLQIKCITSGAQQYGIKRSGAQYVTVNMVNIRNCIIVNDNTADQNGAYGIYINDNQHNSCQTIDNCIIYSLANGKVGIQESDSNSVIINNCVIYGWITDGIAQTVGTITVKDCLVFNNLDDYQGTITVTYSASDDSQTGTGNFQITQTASNYAALVMNAPIGDFRPTNSSSELVGTGTNSGVSTDIIGTVRPQGVSYDIGAFEYIYAVASNSRTMGGKLLANKIYRELKNNYNPEYARRS